MYARMCPMKFGTTQSSVSVLVGAERETPRGWSYCVTVRRPEGETEHSVTLAWVDHDHWCGGAVAPGRVAEAVIRFAAARRALPTQFDCATVRRWYPELDAELLETM